MAHAIHKPVQQAGYVKIRVVKYTKIRIAAGATQQTAQMDAVMENA